MYDVQLLGALSLYDGNIAEMRTGEGKTITSSIAVVLNAIYDKVHVITVNEYLALRDKEELSLLYEKLGFSVSINLIKMKKEQKAQAYNADIMYSTASELGFDYLKDNMVSTPQEKVNQHKYATALIDEVDLVLIDEARTPLIIGKGQPENQYEIVRAQKAVEKLNVNDYIVDIQSQTVVLTDTGEQKINNYFKIDNIYAEKNIQYMYRVNQALLANFIYKKEVDYTIAKKDKKSEKEIVIIDTFTGRIFFGRRFTHGLHQAIEAKHAKEGIKIQDETKTTATITLQNFFRLYHKLSGMSGTAKEESKEFFEIYGVNITVIPPNKPVRRTDFPLVIFKTKNEKWKYVTERVKYHYELGRPVLIGTVSVEDSEVLSEILHQNRLPHKVLNAKQNEEEANIIAQAGRKYSITVATNMAGRGTDIKVDKDTELVVFLTELNESQRIDNQLKGRTSRQGNNGLTETIISLEDGIFEKTKMEALKTLTVINPVPNSVFKVLKMVQEELENSGYAMRNNSLKYDDVIREQRNIFYKSRDKILYEDDINKLKEYLEKLTNNQKLLELEELIKNNKSENNRLMIYKSLILNSIDYAWVDHIDKLESLKDGISWRSYNGSNPFIVYQNEAQILWNDFNKNIKSYISEHLKNIRKLEEVEKEKSAYNMRY